jgi:hypothetical protein
MLSAKFDERMGAFYNNQILRQMVGMECLAKSNTSGCS